MNIYFMVLAVFDHATLLNNNLNGGSVVFLFIGFSCYLY